MTNQLIIFVFFFSRHGSQSLQLKLFIQPIVLLLSDPTATVRDAAIQTLVEVYKHVGDKLRIDLRKKDVPSMKLAILEQKFDEIKGDGLLLPTALCAGKFFLKKIIKMRKLLTLFFLL